MQCFRQTRHVRDADPSNQLPQPKQSAVASPSPRQPPAAPAGWVARHDESNPTMNRASGTREHRYFGGKLTKHWTTKRWMPKAPYRVSSKGNSGTSNVSRRAEAWAARPKTLDVALDTVASNISVAVSHAEATGRKPMTPPGRRPPSFAALLRAHVLIRSSNLQPSIAGLVSADRTRSRPHRSSPTGTTCDRPAGRLGGPHLDPVVEPFGRSGRGASRCRFHGHAHRADLEEHR